MYNLYREAIIDNCDIHYHIIIIQPNKTIPISINALLSQWGHVSSDGPQATVSDTSESGLWSWQWCGCVINGEAVCIQSAWKAVGVRRQGRTEHEEQQTCLALQSKTQLQHSHGRRQILWQGACVRACNNLVVWDFVGNFVANIKQAIYNLFP